MRMAWVLAALVAALCSRAARADDQDAESLFAEARELMERGELAAACPKLEESQRLAPLLQKRAFLGVCHEKEGKTATAWREYLVVAKLAEEAGLDNRADKALALAAALEPRLCRVRIEVTDPAPGEEILVDDQLVGEPLVAGATPVDPGSHRITARAVGRGAWSTDVTVDREGESVPVVVPRLDEVPGRAFLPTPEPAPTTPPVPSAPAVPLTQTARFRTFMIAGGTAAGVSTAALVVGTYFGLHAFSQKAASDAECKVSCTLAAVDFMNGARTSSYVSTAAFGVALASAAVSVALFASGGTKPKARVSLGPGSLRLSGLW